MQPGLWIFPLWFLVHLTAASAAPAQDHSEKHLQQAQKLFEERKFAGAAAEARQAIELNPANIAAWKVSGLSLQLLGRYHEAEQEFSQALKQFPDGADLWFYLGRVQYLQGKLRQSREAVETALRLGPDHADALTQLGLVLEAAQDYEEALQKYRAAARLNQKSSRPDVMPLVSAGQLLMKLGRLEESRELLESAKKLKADSSEIRVSLGLVLEKLKRTGEAEKEYLAALDLDGNVRARGFLDRLRAASPAKDQPPDEVGAPAAIRFADAAATARLRFVLRNSASGNKYQVETMTGGVAVLDYDNDGRLDIYFVNGAELPSLKKTSPQYWNRLFRNNGDGTFTDATDRAGVMGEGYSMGAAVADYDNDGDADIFVAGVNRNILFRNQGDGTFSDETEEAGLEGIDPHGGKLWSVAAAWLDYDNDGHLDLFVSNYCKWDPSLDPYCGLPMAGYRTYCFPDRYEGLPNQLFRNNGDGTFTDVSASSGIAGHIGKGMGVAAADFDGDGFVDIFVANDTVPNFLFKNSGQGRFEEVAVKSGVAVTEHGRTVSGMGVDFRDYNNDGRPDLIVTALQGETFPLFRNLGRGFWDEETYSSRLGLDTFSRSGWSVGFFDLNNDGYKDLFTVNAHVNDNIELYNEQTYRQPNSVYANLGNGTFRDVSGGAGPDFQVRRAHRGCAFADFDNDGKIDVVTTSLNEPAELLLNRSPEENHWLIVELAGTRSNRDGIGAQIKLVSESGRVQFNHVTTSVGYASSSDRRAHFGLGKDRRIQHLEVRWPSGTVQILRDLEADRVLRISEATR